MAAKKQNNTAPAGRAVETVGGAVAVWNDGTNGDKHEWSKEERQALVVRVMQGDCEAVPELRAMLAAHPESVVRLTSPVRTERRARAQELCHEDDALTPELMLAHYDALQRELEGEYPSALERILCEQIVTTQQVLHKLSMVTMVTPQHDEMVTRAHDRLLRATLTLAKVRRLLRPQVAQVNIAESGAQQLNVAGLQVTNE